MHKVDNNLTFTQDVTERTGCSTGPEVLPDGQDQTSGVQAPAAEKPAPVRLGEEEGHCSSCQKRPGKGEFGALYERVMFNNAVPPYRVFIVLPDLQ